MNNEKPGLPQNSEIASIIIKQRTDSDINKIISSTLNRGIKQPPPPPPPSSSVCFQTERNCSAGLKPFFFSFLHSFGILRLQRVDLNRILTSGSQLYYFSIWGLAGRWRDDRLKTLAAPAAHWTYCTHPCSPLKRSFWYAYEERQKKVKNSSDNWPHFKAPLQLNI